MLQIAVKYAERGQKVLYISTKQLNELPTTQSLQKDILRNITFRYHKSYTELVKTLLELHTWTIVPNLIIVESLQLFFDNGNNLIPYKEFIKNHSLTIASLQNAVQSLSNHSDKGCFSIVTLDSNENKFDGYYEKFLQIMLDLYYVQPGGFIQDVDEGFIELVTKYIDDDK